MDGLEIKHPGLASLWIEEAVKESRGEWNVVVAKDNGDIVEESERVRGQLIERDPKVG